MAQRPSDIRQWTAQNVATWVRSLGPPLDKFEGAFEYTTGIVLVSLTDADLSELGVSHFGARRSFLAAIKELAAAAGVAGMSLEPAARAPDLPPGYRFHVFISYRRMGGTNHLAALIASELTARGLKVFFDLDTLRTGAFDTAILADLRASCCDVFVLVPGTLDRCIKDNIEWTATREKDWLRLEIAEACYLKKAIIPVFDDPKGFPSTEGLPADMAAFPRHNALKWTFELKKQCVNELVERIELAVRSAPPFESLPPPRDPADAPKPAAPATSAAPKQATAPSPAAASSAHKAAPRAAAPVASAQKGAARAVAPASAQRAAARASAPVASAQKGAARAAAPAASAAAPPAQPAELLLAAGASIMEAVQRAGPGQTIRLAPGRYQEAVVLEKAVHIVGPREAVLEWGEGNALHCKGPAAPSVRGITIRNSEEALQKKLREGEKVESDEEEEEAQQYPAVWITDGSHVVIEGCDVSSSSFSGIAASGEGTALMLRSNIVHDCGGGGINFNSSAKGTAEANDVFGNALVGITIKTGADPVVRGNKVHDCKQCGIYVGENGHGTVEANDVFGNAMAGIVTEGMADPVVRGNMVHDNEGFGIQMEVKESRGIVEENDVFRNAMGGIGIGVLADPVVRGNKVHDNEDAGISMWNGGQGKVEGNDVFGNACSGIQIITGADPLVRGNKVHDGKDHGIYVGENGQGTVEANDVFGNANAGILITEGADPVVRGNKIHDQQYGIYVCEGGKGTVTGNTLERLGTGPKDAVDVEPDCTGCRLEGNTIR